MEQIIMQKTFCILKSDILKLENLVKMEISEEIIPDNIQFERNDVSGRLYEMWICINGMRKLLYPIETSNAPVRKAGTFNNILKRLKSMEYSLIKLMHRQDDTHTFLQLYGTFVSIVAFFESMEHSKATPYPPLTDAVRTEKESDMSFLTDFVKTIKI